MDSQANDSRTPSSLESTSAPSHMDRDTERDRPHSSHNGRGTGADRGRGGSKSGARGGRAGRGERGGRQRNKEMGRAEWGRNIVDKRARNEENREAAKRRKVDGEESRLPIYATQFSKEELDAQERKPKRKVAVMIGYSGSGYKGMQLNHTEKTIEGDLFAAFVAAGAISKANADDPKKSSLIRCARTDKGVHAAGNLISLKLIVEDPDIVAKINEQLNSQIRVWGIERTNGAFSAYQFCDSRIYEYLIPTHCFLPPHPDTFLAKKIAELAEEANDMEGYLGRQEEVAGFWAEVEEKYMKPVIQNIDPTIRDLALRVFYEHDNTVAAQLEAIATAKQDVEPNPTIEAQAANGPKENTPLENAVRLLKAAHITAKKAYRIHPARLARVHSSLSRFEGSHKYHNYTVDKTFKDPSATRVMKSFKVGEKPIVIGNTEWLSLKVHGQSFMMHQIRKMVSMVALIVRCGCHEGRIQDSYMADKISIPKAPSLGLLLERPVFDNYNEKLEQFGRQKIDFSRYESEIEEFKQREIYERIFREEEKDGCFHSFFTALDNTKSSQLFYLSSVGIEATKREIPKPPKESADQMDIDRVSSDDEGGDVAAEEG